jgi:hypothetical protein
MWVIKHTEYDKYVALTRHGPVWEDMAEMAQKYPSEADAAIDIKRYGIPYCRPKKLKI